jgi:isopenicillin N synthase-like dioxygenase
MTFLHFKVVVFRARDKMSHSLPIVNMKALLQEDANSDAAEQCVKDIGAALRDYGFFYVDGSGVDVTSALQAVKDFFALPLNKKEEIAQQAFRGYTGIDSEVTLTLPDHHECLDIICEAAHDSYFAGQNRWPSALPTMREETEKLVGGLKRVGMVLAVAVARCMDVEVARLRKHFTPGFWILRYLRYPPQSSFGDTSKGIGIGEHTDYGCVTLVAADAPGLRVRDLKTNEWIEATPKPGMFVCNIGDALQNWTCGVCRATPHQVGVVLRVTHCLISHVQVISATERHSIAFFLEPNLDAVIAPVSDFRAHPRAVAQQSDAPFVFGEYLRSKCEFVCCWAIRLMIRHVW